MRKYWVKKSVSVSDIWKLKKKVFLFQIYVCFLVVYGLRDVYVFEIGIFFFLVFICPKQGYFF